MSAFRRVDAGTAGPGAVGILVPPGEQTVVIVRPRPLPWDLLPARWNGDSASAPVFCRFERDEAARIARSLHATLEELIAAGAKPIETFGDAPGGQFQVWLRTAGLFWILCSRAPGQAYHPARFTSHADAVRAAEELAPLLCPAPGAGQEIYFNTQLFA